MKTCSKCGNVSPDTSKFCGFCGNSLEDIQHKQIRNDWEDQSSYKNQRYQAQNLRTPKKQSRTVWYILGAGAIILVCLCSLIAILPSFTKKGSEVAIQATPQTIEKPATDQQATTELTAAPNLPALTETKASENITGIVGQDVRIGNVRWKIIEANDLGNTLKSDNQFMKDLTTPGKFIKVRFEIENLGKEMKTFWGMDLIDSISREFKSSSEAYMYISSSEQNVILTNINPNVPQVITLIYEVSSDAKEIKARISNLEMFGKEEGLIDLGIR